MNPHTFFTRKAIGTIFVLAVAALVFVFYRFDSETKTEVQPVVTADHRNTVYMIDGEQVLLKDGVAEMAAAPGSATKTITRYFGNELKTDLNNDGRDDVVFLVTQERGGSGTFFYAVAALNTENGFVGSDGYLLGDRIAPQTTEISQHPRHRNVVVVNYADRNIGEPMTTKPSVGKSAYLKLDPETMQWGIVEPDFEGESDEPEDEPESMAESWGTILGTVLVGPTCPVMMVPPDPSCADRPLETHLAITTADQSRVVKEVKSDAEGKFQVDLPPGTYAIRSSAIANILPYCAADRVIVSINETVEVTVQCDSGIR